MNITLAYACAALSAASFGLASVIEQQATAKVGPLKGLNLRNFLALGKQPLYAGGLALDGIGFGLFLAAVRVLPLFFVQAVGTASLAFTALAARVILHATLTRRDYKWMALLLAGLALLSLTVVPHSSTAAPGHFKQWLVAGSAAVFLAALAISRWFGNRPVLFSFLSGGCFSAVTIISRILPLNHSLGQIGNLALLACLIICGSLGLMLFSLALQTGSVTRVYGINFATGTVIPAVVGFGFLGDWPLHHLWSAVIAGLLLTCISTVGLAANKGYLAAN